MLKHGASWAQDYSGAHLVRYRNVQPLGYTPESNMMLYVNGNHKIKILSYNKKISAVLI